MLEIKRIDKFGDLIELGISLINEIRGLIEEIPKFGANSGQNYKKLKSKDHFINVIKIQGSNCNLLRDEIKKKRISWIRDLIIKFWNFSDQTATAISILKWCRFKENCSSPSSLMHHIFVSCPMPPRCIYITTVTILQVRFVVWVTAWHSLAIYIYYEGWMGH